MPEDQEFVTARGARMFHRFLLIGLAVTVGVFLAARLYFDRPFVDVAPPVATILAAVPLAVLFFVVPRLRRRVPTRRSTQPVDEYWADQANRHPAIFLWFATEGIGVVTGGAWFVTGATVVAVAALMALGVLAWFHPGRLATAGAV